MHLRNWWKDGFWVTDLNHFRNKKQMWQVEVIPKNGLWGTEREVKQRKWSCPNYCERFQEKTIVSEFNLKVKGVFGKNNRHFLPEKYGFTYAISGTGFRGVYLSVRVETRWIKAYLIKFQVLSPNRVKDIFVKFGPVNVGGVNNRIKLGELVSNADIHNHWGFPERKQAERKVRRSKRLKKMYSKLKKTHYPIHLYIKICFK